MIFIGGLIGAAFIGGLIIQLGQWLFDQAWQERNVLQVVVECDGVTTVAEIQSLLTEHLPGWPSERVLPALKRLRKRGALLLECQPQIDRVILTSRGLQLYDSYAVSLLWGHQRQEAR